MIFYLLGCNVLLNILNELPTSPLTWQHTSLYFFCSSEILVHVCSFISSKALNCLLCLAHSQSRSLNHFKYLELSQYLFLHLCMFSCSPHVVYNKRILLKMVRKCPNEACKCHG